MIGGDNAERWRKKYLDVLDELERKENLWKDTEAFLRQAVSKVSLAADQQDQTLVKAIDRLRGSVRSGAKLDRLKHDLEVVSLAIVELDKQRQKQGKQSTPFETLSTLVDGLDVPKGLQRKARGVDRELAGFDADADPQRAVALVRGLIEEWLAWEREESVSGAATAALPAGEAETDTAHKSGVFRRLFGGGGREDEPTTGTEIADIPGAGPRSEAEMAAYMGTRLAGWLARLTVGEAHDAGRRRLMTRAHKLNTETDINALLDELEHWIEKPVAIPAAVDEAAMGASAPEHEPQAESLVGGRPPAVPFYEVLIRLVQRLDFPGVMAGDVERVIEHLSACPDENQLGTSLREVSDLIAQARSVVQEEKREFESFLSELTSRLKEFEDELGISESNREETRQQREELDAALEGEVRGLQDSIEDAASLDALKTGIKKRLDTLEVHLEAKRRLETRRTEQVRNEIQTLTTRMQALEEEAEVLRINLEQQREQAYRDALTELPNRLAWDETLASEFSRWQRYGRPLVLCVLDIDHFKRINDSFGHKAGDKLLRLVARLASQATRDSDFLARYGGEEFAMLMPETDLAGAEVVAEKLRKAVAGCGAHFNQQKVPVTVSCGLTAFVEGDNPEAAFERADRALYRAKEAGRNRCVVDAHPAPESGV